MGKRSSKTKAPNPSRTPPPTVKKYLLEEAGYKCANPGGKCPEISTVFALKHTHLPRIMNMGTRVSWVVYRRKAERFPEG